MLHSNRNPYTCVLAAGLAVGCTGSAFAQPNLPLPNGQINFTGSFDEFSVPNRRGTILRFTVYGADGADATVADGGCFNFGGQGATAVFETAIGPDATRLNPGQPVRFIVGGAGGRGMVDVTITTVLGVPVIVSARVGGGGGGGSGVVYQSPDVAERNGWVVLSAAGGGGGATTGRFNGGCTRQDENGQNGRTVPSGGTGNDGGGSGGENGQHGDPIGDADVMVFNGGGGGAFGPGPSTPNGDFIGGAAFGLTGDDPVGGAGDTARSDVDEDGGDGGYGFGGGGAGGLNGVGGGGGGGYSGGGGGNASSAGGGGGSFVNAAFQLGVGVVVEDSPVGENGRIDYEVIGQTHDSQFNALELDIDDEGVIETLGSLFGSSASPIAGVPNNGLRDVWYTYTNTSDQIESFRLSGGLDIDLVGLINGANPFGDSGGTLATTLLPGDTIDIRVAEFRPASGFFTLGGIVFPDADDDGVPDDTDVCPGQDDKIDTDGDGVPDCADNCPTDPNVVNMDSGAMYGTFAQAIADASQGDTLQLGACTFFEDDLRPGSRGLFIRGRGIGATVIDGGGNPRIFRFFPDHAATIEDLSLVNTRPDLQGGGAAMIEGASVTLRRVAMEGHDGTGRTASAIYALRTTSVTLDRCFVVENTSGEFGSTVVADASGSGSISILNTVFANNSGGERQEIIDVRGNRDFVIVNTTFANNGTPFAVSAQASIPAQLANVVSDVPLLTSNSIALTSNSIFPGATGNNFDAEPSFVDAANGDYTLLSGSPGIDLGDPVAFTDAGGGDVDIVGNPRMVDDLGVPNAFSDPIDAGAFESQVVGGGCAAADLALPLGVLDLGDIDAFIAGFLAGDPVADIAEPLGVLDLDDIDMFITAFTDGCP